MSISGFSGPVVSYKESPYLGPTANPDSGPCLFYTGSGILDPRTPFTYQGGGSVSAFVGGINGNGTATTLDAVPYTAAAAAIVASANPTSATLTLVSAASATTGVAITTKMVNASTGVVDTSSLVAIDAYASFTASITGTVMTVTANSAGPIYPGMTLLTAGGTGTLSSGVLVTPGGVNNGMTGTFNVSQSQTIGSGTITAQIYTPTDCAVKYGTDGNGQPASVSFWNPNALLGRAVSVTAAAGATYATATITGYDVYGYPMSEAITISAGSAVNGKKAFKYIKSVVLSGGTADTTHAYSVGTADVFGLPIRADTFGDVTVNYAASLTAVTGITAATGFVAADMTVTATTTTGDVRGTYANTSSTGANRLIVRQAPQPRNISTITGLFGVTQA